MIHPHELSAPPMKHLVLRVIEDKVWERYLLGYRSLSLEMASINPDLLEDLKARYKNATYTKLQFDTRAGILHLEW